MLIKTSLKIAVFSLVLAGPAVAGPDGAAPAAAHDVVADNLNPAVSPGDDFFEYANGGWLRRNPIPASESRWSIGSIIREQLYVSLRKINEQGAAAPVDEDARKVGDFWVAALEPANAEKAGLHPLAVELAKVDAVTSAQQALDVRSLRGKPSA